MYKSRLQRLEWVFAREPVYFITTATAERRHRLASPSIHSKFIEFATQASDHGIFVGRYVLMPDHIHLFAAFGSEAPTLSDWMKSLKNCLSKILREQSLSAPHWQKGFFDHILRSAESYAEKWSYVAQNPVRHGLVRDSHQWPYQGEINVLESR